MGFFPSLISVGCEPGKSFVGTRKLTGTTLATLKEISVELSFSYWNQLCLNFPWKSMGLKGGPFISMEQYMAGETPSVLWNLTAVPSSKCHVSGKCYCSVFYFFTMLLVVNFQERFQTCNSSRTRITTKCCLCPSKQPSMKWSKGTAAKNNPRILWHLKRLDKCIVWCIHESLFYNKLVGFSRSPETSWVSLAPKNQRF